METETIDRLFLELSQVTKATTEREADLERARSRLASQLETVNTRMNELADKVAKLEQENAALRANQLPAGAVCFVPTGEVRAPKKCEWFLGKMNGVHYADRDFYSSDYPIYRRVEAQGAEPDINAMQSTSLSAAVLCWAKTRGITLPAKDAPVTSPSPDVASGAEGGEYKMQYCEAEDGFSIFDSGGDLVADFPNDASGRAMSLEYLAYLNGTSPVHQQLAEIERLRAFREEIESLRRCRDAWDAVRKWQMDIIGDWAGDSWKAKSFRFAISRHATDFKADPIEAVLELAKALEKGG